MLLQPEQREKLDPSQDENFYAVPRIVTHVDDSFLDQLTNLYRERLKPNTRILDMMSSWVSHLPDDLKFSHVEGHGMNEEELARNPRLDHYFVQNLNENTNLPFSDEEFDAVLNAVSIQYLQYPETVFQEIYRILKPGGVVIISFSNRMFYQKAITAWRDASEAMRIELVKRYFRSVNGFSEPEAIQKQPSVPAIMQMLGMGGSDPFYAVLAYKNSPET